MIKAPFVLATLASIAFAGFVAAQEASDGDETSAGTGGSLSELDTGVVEGQQPAENPEYTKSTHGDWVIQCLRVAEGPEPCEMAQLLLDDEGIARGQVSIFPVPEGGQVAAGGTIIVPLGTILTEQISIQVDSGPTKRYTFLLCTADGCISRVGFLPEDITAFKRGAVAKVSMVIANQTEQRIVANMSLKGFTAAFEEITNPPADNQ